MTAAQQVNRGHAGAEGFRPVLPGGSVGLLGGGQLGRMFGIAARRLGYRVHTFAPSSDSPAGQISDVEVSAPYEDLDRLAEFAQDVDVVTFEFENIPSASLELVENLRPVHPRPEVLRICQNRAREKEFLTRKGFPCARHSLVKSAAEAAASAAMMGFPAVLKSADFGYDGKGQAKLRSAAEAAEAWERLDAPAAVIEEWVDFRCEISVVCARDLSGKVETFPVSENLHRDHILERSVVPARVDPGIAREAQRLAVDLARALDVVGLLAVEFFVRRDGSLLVNELAPRPHNSGHFTFDACATSQFEQQLRAVCGLALGSPRLLSPVVMVNVLGDAWVGGEPDWAALLSDPDVKLHLYGKSEALPRRKMGHFCVLKPSVEEALRAADAAADRLFRRADGDPGE
ncbi:MAG: 5-(carboxyamino)imidazole ribonucleotide synthase [Chthoniobacterales bacterium]|nr:5-(carboxyamino)imidazole ribonucleotide synthase [Chthoniobacterales bacterium]